MKADILKSTSHIRIVWDPDIDILPELEVGRRPNVSDFYLKKVYRIIPHRNIRGCDRNELNAVNVQRKYSWEDGVERTE